MSASMSVSAAGPSSPRKVIHYASVGGAELAKVPRQGGNNDDRSVPRSAGARRYSDASKRRVQDDVFVDIEPVDEQHTRQDATRNGNTVSVDSTSTSSDSVDIAMEISDDDYIDDESEEEDDDDDITLLPTTRSKSLSPHKLKDCDARQSSPIEQNDAMDMALSSGHDLYHHRTPLQKLSAYIDDFLLCEERDLPDEERIKQIASNNASKLPEEVQPFFEVWQNTAITRTDVFARVNTLARSCQSSASSKRGASRTSSKDQSSQSTGDESDDVRTLESDSLARFIKILYRSITKRGACTDPFPVTTTPVGKNAKKRKSTAQKAATKKSRSSKAGARASDTSTEDVGNAEDLNVAHDADASQQISQITARLSDVLYCIRAAECALSLLSLTHCDDALVCDEMIVPSLQVLRSTLDFFLVPFVRASAGTSTKANALLDVLIELLDNMDGGKTQLTAEQIRHANILKTDISAIILGLQGILSKVQDLAKMPVWQPSNYNVAVLADSLVPLVNCSETSTTASGTLWVTSLAGLRLSALRIVSLLNAKGADSEATVNTVLDHIESYSTSTKRGKQAWLGSDRIQPLTAMIVHLIQDSTTPLEVALRADVHLEESQDTDDGVEVTADDALADTPLDFDKMRHALDKPRDTAKLFAEGLIWRLKAKKATKKGTSTETDLTSVFESLTKDLLLILFSPEWPAAALLASHMTRLLCSALEDRATSPDMRGMAIDFLGSLASSMRASQAKLRSEAETLGLLSPQRFAAIAEKLDVDSLERITESYDSVIKYLSELNRRDGLYISAVNFISAHRAVELACVHHKTSNQLEGAEDSQEQNASIAPFQAVIENVARQDPTKKQGAAFIKNERASTRMLFEQLVHTFNFSVPVDLMCDKLLEASEGPVASNRSKALRGLSSISQADDTFLHEPEVRQAVQRCLLDESVHVRDGAVALLGKFVLANPRYLPSLFLSLRSKIDDSGLLVRKRALRLLADIYRVSTSTETRVQASVSIVRCVTDEEQSMQDMAIEAIVDLWFGQLPDAASATSADKVPSSNTGEFSPTRLTPDRALERTTDVLPVIVAVNDLLTAKSSPLEVVLRRISEDKSRQALARHLTAMIDELSASIGATSEQLTEDAIRQARTMALLVRVAPEALSIHTAREMLSSVRNDPSPAASSLTGQILEAYSNALPVMHKTAVAFARQLQAALRPLVSQPSPHFSILSDIVRCYCLVVRHHTRDFDILVRTLSQCVTMTRNVLRKARTCKPVETIERDDAVIVRLTALFIEHGDFEHIKEHSRANKEALKQLAPRGVAEETTEALLQLHKRHGYAIHALHALRFVYRGHPQLMVTEASTVAVLNILTSGSMQEKAIMLRTIADIMASDEAKSTAKQVKAKKTSLSSATMNVPASFEVLRSYLKPAIALVAEPSLQPLVLEILQHAVLRGLCHPMECLAALVALQTLQENLAIQHDAQRLYKHLISKAQSINFRYASCSRQAWEFQTALKGLLVRGTSISGQALFQPWYSVVRDNQAKPARMELLRAFLKAFDIDVTSTACTGQDVYYARFVAENLASLDLRTPEELNLVTETLQDLILGAGSQIRRTAQEELEVEGEDVDEDDDGNRDASEVQYLIALGRMATIVAIAVLTQAHMGAARGATGSSGAPTRMGASRFEDLSSLPGTSGTRVEGLRLARAELGHLDALLGSLEDDEDDD